LVKRQTRQRRVVSARTLFFLRPALRWSAGRGAWVLRVGGNRAGPVFVVASDESEIDAEEIVPPSFSPIASLGPIDTPIARELEVPESIVQSGDSPAK